MRIDIEEERTHLPGRVCRGHALANQMAAANTPPGGAAHRPSGDLPGDLPAGFRLPEAGPNLPAFRLPWQLRS